MNFIDLFAGAGGLSEGFIRAGFTPIAHVEMDKAACCTLLTRTAYHYLKDNSNQQIYYAYLKGDISRKELYNNLPEAKKESVINLPVGNKFNDVIFRKIDKLKGEKSVDLIIGGPPCQAYSVVGRAPLKHKTNDERTTLYIQYGRYLKKYDPKVFVFENVPGILTAAEGKYYDNLRKYYKRLGYNVEARLLNAYDYGVVQNRNRVFIIGWKKEIDFSYPDLKTENIRYFRDEIFSDLPAIGPGETRRVMEYSGLTNNYLEQFCIRNGMDFVTQHNTRPHNKNDLKIYKLAIERLNEGERLKNNQIPPEIRTQKNISDFLDRFKVVAEEPHTMIAHIAKDGHHFIHPDKKQLRSISIREAARIQSFPDDYFFEGVKAEQYRTAALRQIGNAVPPIMGERIATGIKLMINKS